MNFGEEALKKHREWRGKLEILPIPQIKTREDLSLAYTPGVAEPCKEIHKKSELVYEYTRKGNLVAVVTDGTAVLGLGDIGAKASLPVMEGKCALFKTFANVDAFPICIDTKDIEEIISTVKNISPTFGGINLEDISAPRCFEIEERLQKELDIPVFHDDQHGTAIVVLAALFNALKIVDKDISNIKVVMSGAGAAGTAIAKLLLKNGCKNIILCGRKGAIYKGNNEINIQQQELAEITNPNIETGSLKDVIKGADVFIGVSAGNIVTKEMVQSMNKNSIVFAMANPIPEIMPDEAKEAGAKVIGTGRSDYPNQINNVLAFPGVFRGALDIRASEINDEMKTAAAKAIASLVSEQELSEGIVIPTPFDNRVVPEVADSVKNAAIKTGVAKMY